MIVCLPSSPVLSPSFPHVLNVFTCRKRVDLIGIVVRSADDFCVIVAVALAMQLGGKGRYEDGWIAEVEFGLDVQEQLHPPVGQAQELPQLQVHPGPAPRDCNVS